MTIPQFELKAKGLFTKFDGSFGTIDLSLIHDHPLEIRGLMRPNKLLNRRYYASLAEAEQRIIR